MKQIRYIGHKPYKEDNVAGTGVVWNGHGDVCEVPDRAVALLLQHPDVFELVGMEGPRFTLKVGTGSDQMVFNLDIMNDQELRAICRRFGIPAILAKRGDQLREEIVRLGHKDEAPPPAPPPEEPPPPSDPVAAPAPADVKLPEEAPPPPPIPDAPAPATKPQANTSKGKTKR